MKHKIYLGLLALSFNAIAQTPTGSAPPPTTPTSLPAVRDRVEQAWYRGGNNLGGTAGGANIFGTAATFNSPIFHQTNGINRLQMNQSVSNVVNSGASLSRDGFIGIGVPAGFYNGNAGGQGPFSLLHLNGINASGLPQQGGYRNWMRFGITSTHN